MSVLKTYDMSSIEQVIMTNNEVDNIRKENEFKNYTVKDIMLVRATDIYPQDRLIKPLSEGHFIRKDNKNFIYCKLFPAIMEEAFETYSVYYRDTIHFTENGIVDSHLYGNFENRDFIILEPLEEQIDKADFRNLAGQDTYAVGDIELSNRAILIIESSKYEKILKDYPNIEDFNIILYKGIPQEEIDKLDMTDLDLAFNANYERAIVEQVLVDLGYVPELIGQHYILQSETSDKILKLNEILGNEKGIESNSKHCYSIEAKEEKEINNKISNINDLMLFDFFIKINGLEIAGDDLSKFYKSNGELYCNDAANFLIKMLGLEKIAQDIKNFNNTIEEMAKCNRFPTAKEFLRGNIPNIYEEYLLYKETSKKL